MPYSAQSPLLFDNGNAFESQSLCTSPASVQNKQDISLEFYEFQYQMILPHSLLTYLHLSTDGCHGTLMVSAVVVPSCVVFVFWAFVCCVTAHCRAGLLVNLDSLPVTTNLLA